MTLYLYHTTPRFAHATLRSFAYERHEKNELY